MKTLNLEMTRLFELIKKAILAGYPIWFSADVRWDVDYDTGIMHPEIFDRRGLYDLPKKQPSISREAAAWYFRIQANHAMVISAIDLDEQGKIVKMGVDNSWGEEIGDSGRFHMYREWFEKHGAEIIIPKKLLSDEEQKIFEGSATQIPRTQWYY